MFELKRELYALAREAGGVGPVPEPELPTLRKIAGALGVPLADLL